MAIVTIAEEAPFAIVTKGSTEALFCRSSIVGVVGRVIAEKTSWIVSISVFPFTIVMELDID